jgi:hypothetical protein
MQIDFKTLSQRKKDEHAADLEAAIINRAGGN